MKQIAIICIALFATAAFATPFEITDDAGKIVTGELTALDANRIVLENDGRPQVFPVENVARIRNAKGSPFRTENTDNRQEENNSIALILKKQSAARADVEVTRKFPESVAVVELVDGSRFATTEFRTKGETAIFRLLNGNELSIPLDTMASVRLAAKNAAEVSVPPEDWLRLAGASTASPKQGDRVVIGRPGTLDFYDGILAEVAPETISFIIDGETLPVPRRKVYGLLFYTAKNTPEKNGTTVPSSDSGVLTLYDGCRIRLKNVTLDAGGLLAWTGLTGASGTVALEEIDSVDFSRTNAIFLADLKPFRVEQSLLFDAGPEQDDTPAFSTTLKNFRTNRMLGTTVEEPLGVSGRSARENALPERSMPGLGGVQLDGVSYASGLSIPARTVLEYALPEPFSKLRGWRRM